MDKSKTCEVCAKTDLDDGAHCQCEKCGIDICFNGGEYDSCFSEHCNMETYCINCSKMMLSKVKSVFACDNGYAIENRQYCQNFLLSMITDRYTQGYEFVDLESIDRLIKNLLTELNVLKAENYQLKIQLRYRPDGEGYVEAKGHFEGLVEKKNEI